MPRTPIDYSKTIIYKITCNDDDVDYLYVGSTTDFVRRKACHKSDCNNISGKSYNSKKYSAMRNNGGWDNFRMIMIEEYPCKNRNEAEKREDEVMMNLKANMNTNRASRCRKQYTIDTKDEKKKYDKQYRIYNIKTLKEKWKANYNEKKELLNQKHNCSCGGVYTHQHKARHFKSNKHVNYLNNQIN